MGRTPSQTTPHPQRSARRGPSRTRPPRKPTTPHLTPVPAAASQPRFRANHRKRSLAVANSTTGREESRPGQKPPEASLPARSTGSTPHSRGSPCGRGNSTRCGRATRLCPWPWAECGLPFRRVWTLDLTGEGTVRPADARRSVLERLVAGWVTLPRVIPATARDPTATAGVGGR